jgi:hypothetical protein
MAGLGQLQPVACGIPNAVVSFMGDQSFLGRRVYAIGADQTDFYKKLSVENLTQVILQAESASIYEQVQEWSANRNEDGTGLAVK